MTVFSTSSLFRITLLIWGIASLARGVAAQEHDAAHTSRRSSGHWGSQAVVRVVRESPTIGGRDRTEAYVTQPSIMGQLAVWEGRLRLLGTLNFEGLTLRRGELNAGALGEGYADRRHPHTYVHELIAGAGGRRAGLAFSLSAGKGFAPFGTDDPMARPFAGYPVNHHLAQILERAVIIGAVRHRRAMVELATFNGDEPTGPGDWPNWSRFGDSWSVRGTLFPAEVIELTTSAARVASPENALGGGPPHRKLAASIRFERTGGDRRDYALAEWARTDVGRSDRRPFHYTTALVELELRRGPLITGLRLERTTRPEEERLANPFRTVSPPPDESILGITRWEIVTATLGAALWPRRSFGAEPFVEVGWLHASAEVQPTFFRPSVFYGSDRIWSLSAGLRLRAGTPHRRMGRYGVAADHLRVSTAHSH
jgi:hypothetical protein